MHASATERARRVAAAAVPPLAALSCAPFVEPLHTSNFATWAVLLLVLADPAAARRLGALFKPLWVGGLALCLLSALVADSPWRVFKGTGDVARGLLLALPVAWCLQQDAGRFRRLLGGMGALVVLGLGAWVAYAIATAPAWPAPGRLAPGVTAPLVSGNVAASAVTCALLALAAMLPARAGLRIAALLLVAAGLALTVQLGSRGALLAFLAALPLLFVARAPRAVAALYGVAAVAGGLALAMVLLVPGAAGDLAWWLGKNGSLDNGRAEIYRQTLHAVTLQPWLGWGINNFKVSAWDWVAGRPVGHPHALWLELLFSLGLIGSAVLLALLWRVTRPLVQQLDLQDPAARLGLALLAWLVARGLFDLGLFHYATAATLGIALGLLAGARARAA